MGGIKIVLLLSFLTLVSCCPPKEDLEPFCHCKAVSSDYMMFCSKFLSPEQLISPIKAISMNNVHMFSLSIDESSLMYIPDGIFKDTHIEKIRFVNSEIMSLSDSDVAFSGLENTLTEIRATAANYIAQWDWQQLRNLKKLSLIDINYINLGSIDVPFPHLPKLSALGIIRADISFIVDSAFANLPQLVIFNMRENDISELKRNMLPNPAQSLLIMDLSDNELSNLPEDFFSHMPSLQQVHLDKNKFVTLTENPFLQAVTATKELTMTENPFRCDCRMRWIVGAPVRSWIVGQCSAPETLSGTEIRDLDLKSLWCY